MVRQFRFNGKKLLLHPYLKRIIVDVRTTKEQAPYLCLEEDMRVEEEIEGKISEALTGFIVGTILKENKKNRLIHLALIELKKAQNLVSRNYKLH